MPWLKFVCICEAVLIACDIISQQLKLLQFMLVMTDHHPSTISLSFQTMVRAIKITSPHCDPMTYPLLIPFGHLGWQMRTPRIAANSAPNSHANITLREHYLIHISIRDQYSAIHRGRGLFQQFLVDAYCKVESNSLNVYRTHQKELRRESIHVLLITSIILPRTRIYAQAFPLSYHLLSRVLQRLWCRIIRMQWQL